MKTSLFIRRVQIERQLLLNVLKAVVKDPGMPLLGLCVFVLFPIIAGYLSGAWYVEILTKVLFKNVVFWTIVGYFFARSNHLFFCKECKYSR